MSNEKVIEFLLDFYNKETDDTIVAEDLHEFLLDEDVIYEENYGSHRWFDDLFCVVQVNDRLIGYNWYHTTGDSCPYEMGLEFENDSICFAEAREIKKIEYFPIKEE